MAAQAKYLLGLFRFFETRPEIVALAAAYPLAQRL
jgi:hypothetical protein